jgi:hypothetical protein
LKYFSMFSGIGGFELGIHRAMASRRSTGEETAQDIQGHLPDNQCEYGRHGATCIGFSEVNKYAIQCYESHFKGHKNYGDATKINATELPDFDFLCGGFPCQAFSIAGKRGGFDDTRGTMFFEIARILAEKRPRMFLLENVKGLLSHDNGRTFKPSSPRLLNWGMVSNGKCLTARISASPRTGNGCSLSDILEESVEEKYFLSNKSEWLQRILRSVLRKEDMGDKGTALMLTQTPPRQTERIHHKGGLSPTIPTASGGRHIPMICESDA